jgi:hypothetical protein
MQDRDFLNYMIKESLILIKGPMVMKILMWLWRETISKHGKYMMMK